MSYTKPTQCLLSNETVGTPFRPYGRFIVSLHDLPANDPTTSDWFLEAIPDGLDQSDDGNWVELHTTAFTNTAGRKSMYVDGTFAYHYRLNNKATGTAASGVIAYWADLPTLVFK